MNSTRKRAVVDSWFTEEMTSPRSAVLRIASIDQ